MVNKRKKAHEQVEEIYNDLFSAGNVEFVDEEMHENTLGLTHTNVSIVHVPDSISVSELSDFTDRLSQKGYATSIDETDEMVVNVMYSYDVIEDLGLV